MLNTSKYGRYQEILKTDNGYRYNVNELKLAIIYDLNAKVTCTIIKLHKYWLISYCPEFY